MADAASYAEQINDPDSELVRGALTRRCLLCKAQPGSLCTNTISFDASLDGRIIHHARTCP